MALPRTFPLPLAVDNIAHALCLTHLSLRPHQDYRDDITAICVRLDKIHEAHFADKK